MKLSFLLEAFQDFERAKAIFLDLGADEATVNSVLLSFKQFKEQFKQDKTLNFDISYWSRKPFRELRLFVLDLGDRADKIERAKEAKISGAKRIYRDKNVTIYHVTTYEASKSLASIKYGDLQGRWCISADSPKGVEDWKNYVEIDKFTVYFIFVQKSFGVGDFEKMAVVSRQLYEEEEQTTFHNQLWDYNDGLVDFEDYCEKNKIPTKYFISRVERKPGYNPKQLVEAARHGNIDKVKRYLAMGVHDEEIINKSTALRAAVASQHIDVMKLLLKAGAATLNSYVDTPILEAAAYTKNLDVVKTLVEAGANVYRLSNLEHIVQYSTPEILRYLLEQDKQKKLNKWFPFAFAFRYLNLEAMKVLADHVDQEIFSFEFLKEEFPYADEVKNSRPVFTFVMDKIYEKKSFNEGHVITFINRLFGAPPNKSEIVKHVWNYIREIKGETFAQDFYKHFHPSLRDRIKKIVSEK